MSGQPTPTELMDKAKRFVQSYMQDQEILNRLIRQEECSETDRELAIMMSVGMYNETTPISTMTLTTFPSLNFLRE